VVASDAAEFGFPEVKRGVVVAQGGKIILPCAIRYQAPVAAILMGAIVKPFRGLPQ
jgi:enoyl-CoA hydratase/carnithine racemase